MRTDLLHVTAMITKALLLLAVIGIAPLAWVLRDGLGPNAVDSFGMAAFWRWFQTFWVGPLIIVLATLVFALHRAARTHQQHAEPGASPNGDPATPLGNSEVTKGPPSVS